MSVFRRVSDLCRSALSALICAIIAVLLAIMVTQIVFRYGFNSSLIWAEEVCRYLLIWVSFLAAFAAYERGEIASVTFVRDLLPRKGRIVVAMACNALGLVLLVALIVYGLRYADRIGSQPIPALGFLLSDLFGEGTKAPATYWVYVALPVGMALLAARLLADLVHYALMFSSGGDPADLRRHTDPASGEPQA